MKRCPECKQFFGDEVVHCPNDGTLLAERIPGRDPFMGRILAGRYEVLDLVGKGGFGVVFKVRDRKMEDIVALKVFDRRRFTDQEAQEAMRRFRREGVLLRRTGKRSNNIVTVYDFEEDESEELFYFTMDYVEGTTLAKILAEEGPLSVPRVLDLGRQICSALKAAHFEGIVHRDLKLENVMVVQEADRELVKVLDFGIAKVVGSKSLTNLAMGVPGTPGYAPPEQLRDPEKIDARTDLFALGVVLYGLLTGREPWSGGAIIDPPSSDKVWDLIQASLENEPTPLRKWDPEIPRQLEAIVLKLLNKDQDDRVQSAEKLEKELTGIQELLDAQRPKQPGALLVQTAVPDVKVAVRRGFRTIARGKTPWTARSLAPGEYRVEIRDRRYHKESRTVEVTEGDEVPVHLSATAKPAPRSPRELLGETYRRFRTPILALGILVVVVLAGTGVWWLLPSPRQSLTMTEFMAAAEEGAILQAGIRGGNLEGLFRADAGEEERFRVSLAGVGVQDLVARIRGLGIPMATSGRGSVHLLARDDSSGNPITDVVLSVEGEGVTCSPCSLDEPRQLPSGWYAVEGTGEEWLQDTWLIRDGEEVYATEEVDESLDSLFLPAEAALELVATFRPTELRLALQAAARAREEGDLRRSAELVDSALLEAPGHSWATAARDSVLEEVRERIALSLRNEDAEAALQWGEVCRDVGVVEEECRRPFRWVTARQEAAAALEQGRFAAADDLAGECLSLAPGDTECARVREKSRTALSPTPSEPLPEEEEPALVDEREPDVAAQEASPVAEEEPVTTPTAPPDPVEASLADAFRALEGGEGARALASFRRAQAVEPAREDVEAARDSLLRAVRTLALDGRDSTAPEVAMEWAELCLELEPTDGRCRSVTEWVEVRRQARATHEEGSFRKARTWAERCLELHPSDSECQRIAEGADTELGGAGGEEQPRPAPEEGAAVRASGLAVQGFEFADDAFSLTAAFTAEGPEGAPLCVVSVFEDAGDGSLRDEDGEFALGGQVAVIRSPTAPGSGGGPVRVEMTLPVDQLHRDRGQVDVFTVTRIWPGPCESVDPQTPSLVETRTESICIFRFPGGWNRCRR